MKLFNLFFYWLMFSAVLSTDLQAGSLQRLIIDDSLPSVGIYSITQDQQGFIWLASTNTGVLRYDGYQFLAVESISQPDALAVPDIDALQIDHQGNLWVGSWGYGLVKLNANGQPKAQYTAGAGGDLASGYVQSIFEDSTKQVWVGTDQGLYQVDANQKLKLMFSVPGAKQLADPRVWSMTETADQLVWIGTSKGLHSYSVKTGLSEVYLPHGENSNDNVIRSVIADQNNLWIGTGSALFYFDTAHRQFQRINFFGRSEFPIINTLALDGQGHLLVGTFDGIVVVHQGNQQTQFVEGEQTLLAGVNVRKLFVDRSGLLWAGTREKGLYKGRILHHQFNQWPNPQIFDQIKQHQEAVVSILSEDEIIWIGRSDSVEWYNTTSGAVTNQHIGARVNALVRDAKQQLWLAADNGLYQFSKTSQQFIAHNELLLKFKLPIVNVRDLAVLPDGGLAIGLWGGGLLISYADPGRSRLLLADMGRKKVGDAVRDLWVDQQNIWIATRLSGILHYDLATAQLQQINEQVPGLPLRTLCVDRGPAGSVLICERKGLVIYDPVSHDLRFLGKEHGLPDPHTLAVYTDPEQRIWVSTNAGLSVLPAGEQKFITYTQMDGLTSSELMFKAISANGQVFFVGTALGVDRIDTASIWSNEQQPLVAITAIKVDQRQITNPLTQCCEQIQLLPNQNSIEFEFATLDYHNVGQNRFMVKLAGFDQGWTELTSTNKKFYANLPPGDYEFQLKGANNHGVFQQKITAVKVAVLPAWWQLKKIQFALVLLLITVLYLLYSYRLRQMRRINELLQISMAAQTVNQQQLEAEVSSRTKQLSLLLTDLADSNHQLKRLDALKDDFIATVSHELRTPLTSIHGAIKLLSHPQVMSDQATYQQLLTTADQNSTRLVALINDLLDLQKFESGAMELNIVPTALLPIIEQAINGLKTYASQFQVELATTVLGESQLQVAIDSHRIRQVLDNLLSNAIKFSKMHGTVVVEVNWLQIAVQVSIIDQGEGIPLEVQNRIFGKFVQADSSTNKSRYGTGLGLAISKKIIELHQGTIGFDSVPGEGCRFWFELPLNDTSAG